MAMGILKTLHDEDVIGGVFVTEDAYHGLRSLFGLDAKPYAPGGVSFDVLMEQVFVVDGVVFFKGVKLQ